MTNLLMLFGNCDFSFLIKRHK